MVKCIIALYRWRLVVHGGVDAYSRMPVYLHCSSNNQAGTVLDLFRKAVTTYGLPSRIHIDKGGENVDVAMYLLTHPCLGLDETQLLLVKVYTTNALRGCGGMSTKGSLGSIMGYFTTWNQLACLTQTMTCTSSVFILYIFLESTGISSLGEKHGLNTL